MSDSTSNTPSVPDGYKRCSSRNNCVHPDGPILPATREYFHFMNKSKGKLYPQCIKCRAAKYFDNPGQAIKRSRLWWQEHKDEANQGRRDNRNEDTRAREKAWKDNNIEKVRKYKRDEYQKHRDEILRKERDDRRLNPDKYKEKGKKAYLKHKFVFQAHAKARKGRIRQARSDGENFTARDWERTLSYFNGCCAVCGRQLDDLFGTHTAAADHWQPIKRGGANTPDNIIPLCHSKKAGANGCNNSKLDKDPVQWLIERYGKRKAKAILGRIEAYFEWVRSQGGE